MDANPRSVLLICSPSKTLHAFADVLKSKLLEPIAASTLRDAEPILRHTPLALVICASQLLDGSYRDVLAIAAVAKPSVPVIVVSLMPSGGECDDARRLGAVEWMPRPLCPEQVQNLVERCVVVISEAEGVVPA